jgi:hypothetical protein
MKGVTKYQFEVLSRLREIEVETGRLSDFDQLLTRLSWTPTKESAQFTIRAVVGKGFIEKAPVETRRGRNRVCYRITVRGGLVLDPRGAVMKVEKDTESLLPGSIEPELEMDLEMEPELEIESDEVLKF